MTRSSRTILIYLIPLLAIFFQCSTSKNETKSIEYYPLTIVIPENLHLKGGTPMNEGLKLLFNYYTDSVTVFAPIISFIRIDTSLSMEDFTVPLSSLNAWRKNIDMLSTLNFLEDYDESLKHLTIPSILAYEAQNSASSDELSKYDGDSILYVGDNLASQVESLRKTMKNGKNITVLLKLEKSNRETVAPSPEKIRTTSTSKKVEKPEEQYSPKEVFIINCSDQNSRYFLSWTDIKASYYVVTIKDMDTEEIVYKEKTVEYSLDVINIGNLIGSRQYELKVEAKRKNGRTISFSTKPFSLIENREMINPSCCK